MASTRQPEPVRIFQDPILPSRRPKSRQIFEDPILPSRRPEPIQIFEDHILPSRRQEPLPVFQDPVITSFDHPEVSHMDLGMLAPNPLRSIQNPPSRRRVIFDPPMAEPQNPPPRRRVVFQQPMAEPTRPSPQKSSTRWRSLPKPVRSGTINLVPMPPPSEPIFITDSPEKKPVSSTFETSGAPHPPSEPIFITDSPEKKPVYSTFETSRAPHPPKALFSTFQTAMSADKENLAPSDDPFVGRPQSSHGQKGPLKRTLMDPAPIRDRQPKKVKLDEPVDIPIPEPADMPPVEDDGNKPPYSYATLIGMSLLRAPSRRLTLAQIYKWISDTFLYYRTTETGWQNSIRHNLSLNKAFIKQERPKDDPGKGNYWSIAPGCEAQFLREKQGRRSTSLSFTARPPAPAKPTGTQASEPEAVDLTRGIDPRQSVITSQAPATDPSSDATIPASDIAAQEIESASLGLDPRPSSHVVGSSPILINSSPPFTRPRSRREVTPPSAFRFPPPSGWSRKRKASALNDSDYHSTVGGGLPAATVAPSEVDLDRSRIRSDRAEDEIARMRERSSHLPSSPLRHFDGAGASQTSGLGSGQGSPSTNLRTHRDKIRALVGSPVRGLACLQEETPWSPAWAVDDQDRLGEFDEIFAAGFGAFGNRPKSLLPSPGKGSPVKRRRLEGPSTSNVLADITLNGSNMLPIAANPASLYQGSEAMASDFPFLRSPSFSASPSKPPTSRARRLRVEDLEGFLDEQADKRGLGIQQDWTGENSGYGILTSENTGLSTTTTNNKRRLGRSSTTRS